MKIIGHRGARGLAKENTLTSICQALEAGADEIEVDVRVTKDNVPVLCHDKQLENGLKIADLTHAELLLHIPEVATLSSALHAFAPTTHLRIEIKPNVAIQPIKQVLGTYIKSSTIHTLSIASFDQNILLEFRHTWPDITLVVNERLFGVRAVARAKELKTPHIAMNHHNLWFGFIANMARRGYKVSAYTLNNPRKARRWQRFGLEAVITDYPDKFRV